MKIKTSNELSRFFCRQSVLNRTDLSYWRLKAAATEAQWNSMIKDHFFEVAFNLESVPFILQMEILDDELSCPMWNILLLIKYVIYSSGYTYR